MEQEHPYKRERQYLMRAISNFFGISKAEPPRLVDGNGVEIPIVTNSEKMLWDAQVVEYRDNMLKSLLAEMSMLSINICGGAITSIFTASAIKDLDFYVEDVDKMLEAIAFFDRNFGTQTFKSINAISWKRRQGTRTFPVQLITRFTGPTSVIFEDFDFTVCQGAFNIQRDTFEFSERFLPDICKREIRYCGRSHYPICAMFRTLKYQRKGFKLSGITVMKIALAIAQLRITTYGQLKEQLFGIDTMYLQGLLGDVDPDIPFEYGEFVAKIFDQKNPYLIDLEESEED